MLENEDIGYDNDSELLASISGALDEDNSQISEQPEVVETVSEVVDNTPTPELFTVKIDGVERQVTIDELKNGYQRQSDYTRKTQELSQEKAALQTKEQEYSQYLQSIPMLAQVAQANISEATGRLYDPEFIKLAETDPALFISEKAKLERVIHQNQSAAQSMASQWEEYQKSSAEVQQKAYEDQLRKSHEILSNEIEGWSDGSAIQAIADYAQNSGFTKNELESLVDHRQAIILNKARLYDELIKNQNIASKKVQSVPSKVLKPGVPNTTQEEDDYLVARNRAIRSDNDRDIADLISKMLG